MIEEKEIKQIQTQSQQAVVEIDKKKKALKNLLENAHDKVYAKDAEEKTLQTSIQKNY